MAAGPGSLTPIAVEPGPEEAPAAPGPATAEVRAWASAQGITVPSRGKLGAEIWDAWRAAHDGNQDPDAASSPQAG